MHNQRESLREDGQIKLATCVSDLLRGAITLSEPHREILKLFLERLELIEKQMQALDQNIAGALRKHNHAVLRLAEVPGYGADSAQPVIAEVGPAATAFPSAEQMSSWVGTCPGPEESAELSKTNPCPKGNRPMRRVLNPVAQAAVKTKRSVFEAFYRRLLPRLGHKKALWAVAHRLCRLTWKILPQNVKYQERGNLPNPNAVRERSRKFIRQLRQLGYDVQLIAKPTEATA